MAINRPVRIVYSDEVPVEIRDAKDLLLFNLDGFFSNEEAVEIRDAINGYPKLLKVLIAVKETKRLSDELDSGRANVPVPYDSLQQLYNVLGLK